MVICTEAGDTGMELMEIILLIAGGMIFILSFFIPDGKSASGGAKALSEDEMNALLARELTAVRGHVDVLVEEAVEDSMEKTKRSLEKLSNEKMMAVNEYSDTVLAEIHKNHEEVLFLYDMLNNKHTNIKDALGEINRSVQDAQKAAEVLKKLLPEGTAVKDISEEQPEAVRYPVFTDQSGVQAARREAVLLEKQQVSPENPSFAEEEPQAEQETDELERNNNARILELYREGKTEVDIARDLSLGVGEVKLVVDLFKNQ